MIATAWGFNYDKEACVKETVLSLEQLGGRGNFKDEASGNLEDTRGLWSLPLCLLGMRSAELLHHVLPHNALPRTSVRGIRDPGLESLNFFPL